MTLNLVEPGTLYGERLNQLDIRFGKLLRAGTDADVAEPRSLQRVQRQHRAGRERDLLGTPPSTSGACRRRS